MVGRTGDTSPPVSPAVATPLWTVDITDPDGVGECQRDGKRQSLGYGDDKDGDADDEELDKLLDVLVGPRQVTNGKRRDAEPQHQDHHRRDRDCRPYTPTVIINYGHPIE